MYILPALRPADGIPISTSPSSPLTVAPFRPPAASPTETAAAIDTGFFGGWRVILFPSHFNRSSAPLSPPDMPPKSQKKLCSRKNCSGVDCPFPHAAQTATFKQEPLAPKTRYHGACPVMAAEKVRVVIPPSEVLVKPSCHAVPARARSRTLCRGCRQPFALPAAEQEWYVRRAMTLPKRCAACRFAARQRGRSEDGLLAALCRTIRLRPTSAATRAKAPAARRSVTAAASESRRRRAERPVAVAVAGPDGGPDAGATGR